MNAKKEIIKLLKEDSRYTISQLSTMLSIPEVQMST